MSKKTLFRIAGALVLLFVVLLVVGMVYVDQIAATAIREGGTNGLGVATEVENVSIAWLGGTSSIKKLSIGTPDGYTSDHTLTIGSLDVQASLSDLRGQPAQVGAIVFTDLDLVIESKDGSTNIQDIVKHVNGGNAEQQAPAAASEPAAEPAPPKQEQPAQQEQPEAAQGAEPAQTFVVRELRLVNVAIHVDALPLPGGHGRLDVTIPEIKLTNLGEGTNGIELAELGVIILAALTRALVQMATNQLPEAMLIGLKAAAGDASKLGLEVIGDAKGKVTDKAGKVLSDVGAAGKALFTHVGKGAADIKKAIKDGPGKAIEGMLPPKPAPKLPDGPPKPGPKLPDGPPPGGPPSPPGGPPAPPGR